MRAINRTTKKDQDLEADDDGNLYVNGAAGARFTVLVGNPTGTTFTSKAASVTSAALGAASAYTGGVDMWNSDTSIAIFVGVGTITAAAGANKVCLGPGQGVHWSGADVSTLHLISASGTPILSWIGNTL